MQKTIDSNLILQLLTSSITSNSLPDAIHVVSNLSQNPELQTMAADFMFTACIMAGNPYEAYDFLEYMQPGPIKNAACLGLARKACQPMAKHQHYLVPMVSMMTPGVERNKLIREFLPTYLKNPGCKLDVVYSMRVALGDTPTGAELRSWVDTAFQEKKEYLIDDLVPLLKGKQRTQISRRTMKHFVQEGNFQEAESFAEICETPLSNAELDEIIAVCIRIGEVPNLIAALEKRKRKLRAEEEDALFRTFAEHNLHAAMLAYLEWNPKSKKNDWELLRKTCVYFVEQGQFENVRKACSLGGQPIPPWMFENTLQTAMNKGEWGGAFNVIEEYNNPDFTRQYLPALFAKVQTVGFHGLARRMAKFVGSGPDAEKQEG